MPISMSKSQVDRERGTILIVVVAVLALVGAIMLLGIGAFNTGDDQDTIHRTQMRQDLVIHELAAYVHLNNQLPCPADPTVDPSTNGFGMARNGGCAEIGQATGIIPFRTLHLSDYDARDGWGRYMTYRISPIMANLGSPATDTIYMRCRRFPWFDGNPPAGPTYYNVYPQKAIFCCPPNNVDGFDTSTDLQILNTTGGTSVDPNVTGRLYNDVSIVGSQYGAVNTPSAGVNGDTQGALGPMPVNGSTVYNEEMFAIAIISHGKNGIGAFIPGLPAPHNQLAGQAGTDEKTNFSIPGDNSNIVIDRPIDTTPGTNYFDDIVTWRTQISLMATLNNASCYIPWH